MEAVYVLIFAVCVGAGVFAARATAAYLDLPRGWAIFFLAAFAYAGFTAASSVIQWLAMRLAKRAEMRRALRHRRG